MCRAWHIKHMRACLAPPLPAAYLMIPTLLIMALLLVILRPQNSRDAQGEGQRFRRGPVLHHTVWCGEHSVLLLFILQPQNLRGTQGEALACCWILTPTSMGLGLGFVGSSGPLPWG